MCEFYELFIKYYVVCYRALIIDLVIKICSIIYSYIYIHIYNLSKVFIILTLLVKCKISIISSIDPMECLLSKRCCAKRRFSIALFEIQEVFVEFYLQWSASFVQYTFCYNHDMLTDRHHNCQICLD